MEDAHLNDRDFFFDFEEEEYGWKRYDGNSIPGNKIPKSKWSGTNDVGVNSKEILTVVDKNNEIVGSLNPSKVIKVIFGK